MRRWAGLCVALVLYTVMSIIGIGWGLPSRDIDPYLFGDETPWPGEKIARLAQTSNWSDASRGADVDRDPLTKADSPVRLNASEHDVAAILLRYRLYTHQPDEMITMRALAGMRPGRFQFDPRLYQYGGLFIYPVGVLIRSCGLLGLIDVRADLTYYLDDPEAFGRFYVAARAYVAVWGLLGVALAYAIAARLGGFRAAILAALLFALLPVVVCMSHEAKPHLSGAVLMLAAVWLAMRAVHAPVSRSARRDWMGLCLACGAAVGMVLSSVPILSLIPWVEFVIWRNRRAALDRSDTAGQTAPANARSGMRAIGRALLGVALALGVYGLTNPYVLINAIFHPAVLRSNFGNSLAMYEVARVGEGLLRVIELTVDGATLPVTLLGVTGLVLAMVKRRPDATLLAVAAGVFFVQFVLIGAGKPNEYGRFGVFPCAALAIAAACVLGGHWPQRLRRARWAVCGLSLAWAGLFAAGYLRGFVLDGRPNNGRVRTAAAFMSATGNGRQAPLVAMFREPAPYCCPPLPCVRLPMVYRTQQPSAAKGDLGSDAAWVCVLEEDLKARPASVVQRLVAMLARDWRRAPISWANVPVILEPMVQAFPTADGQSPPGPGQ